MKKSVLKSAYIIMALTMVVGCKTIQNSNSKQKGAVIGAGSGAAIGGVIGNNVGSGNNTVLGAILGAAIGGVAGGFIGDHMDRQAERIEEEIPGAEVSRVGEGINVTFNEDAGVYFDTNKSDVKGTSQTTLNKMAQILKDYPKSNVLVEGHTDSAGPEDYNMNLSKQRATSVTNYLISQGIDKSRLETRWYGEAQPVGDNTTTEGKAKNRRVELAIVASEALKQEAKQKVKG
ncbi:OmpA family protein [Zobellia laminariae]|uniref:OmpA family protein n=1 Tax=Zobellia laminariae TaxID=248906 RepID=UPI0012D9CE79|nr:OmpA family protein [Zobellia laminariae]MUH40562.1 OmpA family protein [Zobellia laminariae]WKX75809.1 OmpA family protein [Zobellia laminariae]